MLGNTDVVGFVATTDKERAREFYEEVLGLTVVGDDGFALVLDANGTTIRVTPLDAFTPLPFTLIGWQVDDVSAVARTSPRRGVAFERYEGIEHDEDGVWHTPNGDQVAWFKDPDGNLLSVSSQGSGG